MAIIVHVAQLAAGDLIGGFTLELRRGLLNDDSDWRRRVDVRLLDGQRAFTRSGALGGAVSATHHPLPPCEHRGCE